MPENTPDPSDYDHAELPPASPELPHPGVPPAAAYPPPGTGAGAGAYPPPGAGAYPPSAGAAYPPPGPGGYPQPAYPPPQPVGADIGGGIKWSWDLFRRNPMPMVLPGILMLVATVAAVVIGAVGFLWMFGDSEWSERTVWSGGETETVTAPDSVNWAGLIPIVLAVVAVAFVYLYLQAGVIAGAIRAADGEVVQGGSFVQPTRLGAVIATMILMGLAVVVGLILCIIPGLVLIFALQYTLLFVMDEGLGPVAAMKASWRLSFGNLGESLLVFIVHYIYGWVGGIFAGLGAIVTLPMGEAFMVHSFRALRRRPVPALT